MTGHSAATKNLLESYDAIPEGAPVRLAKRTSNLFRFRDDVRRARAGRHAASTRSSASTPRARTADVQGMTTYEDLVDATLPYGLMPLVVPQLKTITLGGAVTGLGIESSSFHHGLPHESVIEMEILTGDGEIVTATPDNEHRDLFYGFPNSYGTLGYALRLQIELQPVKPFVELRHVRFAVGAGARRGDRRAGTDDVRLRRRHGLRPTTSSTSRSARSPTPRSTSPTTPDSRSTTGRSRTATSRPAG